MQIDFHLSEIKNIATELWRKYHQYKIWAFNAPMGAGKTTFVHAVCDVLGVEDAVSSPTFSIINEYRSASGIIIYHLDLYRLKDDEEAISAGVEDCLYSGIPIRVCRFHCRRKAAL